MFDERRVETKDSVFNLLDGVNRGSGCQPDGGSSVGPLALALPSFARHFEPMDNPSTRPSTLF